MFGTVTGLPIRSARRIEVETAEVRSRCNIVSMSFRGLPLPNCKYRSRAGKDMQDLPIGIHQQRRRHEKIKQLIVSSNQGPPLAEP